jgi:hypothetical protein
MLTGTPFRWIGLASQGQSSSSARSVVSPHPDNDILPHESCAFPQLVVEHFSCNLRRTSERHRSRLQRGRSQSERFAALEQSGKSMLFGVAEAMADISCCKVYKILSKHTSLPCLHCQGLPTVSLPSNDSRLHTSSESGHAIPQQHRAATIVNTSLSPRENVADSQRQANFHDMLELSE